MKLIEPSVKLLTNNLGDATKFIEMCGRVAYKSEDKITDHSHRQFVQMIIKRQHLSVLEHVSASVRFICDRGVSHEIVRHRLASYTQESTRYCNYKGGVTFIKPCFFPKIPCGEYTELMSLIEHCLSPAEASWAAAIMQSEASYLDMIKNGASPQQARSVLPNSLKTEIIMTCNLREWLHFFHLRTSPKSHPQMREIAGKALWLMHTEAPTIFSDEFFSMGDSN